ncbi:hypothetical protein [uncultured Psychrobacter sp.]|uniref:hypothetical protein n=1 Tax=uncultured Psychrobacter sp. TaxID=259303 RepID=UPI0030D95DD8
MDNNSPKKNFKVYDKEFAERNKNRRVDILNFFLCVVLILACLLAVLLALPKPFLNSMVTSGKEIGGMCYLNAHDLAIIIGSELYMERVMSLIFYKSVIDTLVAVVFAVTFGFLAADYLTHLYNTFYAIPKGHITSDYASYHKKPILTNPRALALYLALSAMLISTSIVANNMSVDIINIFQNRHSLIRDNFVLKEQAANEYGIRDVMLRELDECIYNPNIKVIEGKSYYQAEITK